MTALSDKLKIECADASLVESSYLCEASLGILTWVVNLKVRWLGFDRRSGININKQSFVEYVFDNGCGLVDSISLTGLDFGNYHKLHEMEKDQLVIYFIPMSQITSREKQLAEMVISGESNT